MNWHNRVDSTQLDTQRSCDSVAAVGSHNHLRVCVPCAKHCRYVRACDIYVRSILTTTIAAQQNILSASARYLRLQYLKPPQALLWIPIYPTVFVAFKPTDHSAMLLLRVGKFEKKHYNCSRPKKKGVRTFLAHNYSQGQQNAHQLSVEAGVVVSHKGRISEETAIRSISS